MSIIRLQGIRGGVGTTSLVAALAYELNRLGQRVLVVDHCPENMLRLHFERPFAESGGWAHAWKEQQDWREQAWELRSGLCLLPYGRVDAMTVGRLDHWLQDHPDEWPLRLAELTQSFDWILLDTPHHRLSGHCGSLRPDLDIQVLRPDAACHALLQGRETVRKLMINGYDPASRLQQDLLLLWRHQYGDRLLPLPVYQDEGMAESMAYKQPVGAHAVNSQAADTLRSLAIWCLSQQGGRHEG
ncbi:cellulose biosynthesis protein BcsQ [Marinobacterium marinum]|uniref:Cellulose synthase operon protein YhjQ n=1 Tax=Marinobacterium marinum TaxID=2756129 RepID=A0A7W2AAC3_9GAMM|nr:cellulose biosynthesis protein BcsQ [Marinobacterium marinum]MBA4500835.1 cellulose synthase operon protein YhjQ [Marinobacterium marinum]